MYGLVHHLNKNLSTRFSIESIASSLSRVRTKGQWSGLPATTRSSKFANRELLFMQYASSRLEQSKQNQKVLPDFYNLSPEFYCVQFAYNSVSE